LLGLTKALVNIEHKRVAQFEHQGYAFAHYADTVDRVDDCLGFRVKDVSTNYGYV